MARNPPVGADGWMDGWIVRRTSCVNTRVNRDGVGDPRIYTCQDEPSGRRSKISTRNEGADSTVMGPRSGASGNPVADENLYVETAVSACAYASMRPAALLQLSRCSAIACKVKA